MVIAIVVATLAVALNVWPTHGAPNIVVNVTAITGTIESDWSATFYSDREPLLLGNDAGPDTGGIRAYSLNSGTPLREHASAVVGRTKLVRSVYDVGGKDLAITIAQPDSVIRLFELPSLKLIQDAQRQQLGDWSALCSWKSRAGNQYLFLFGKRQAVQLLVRADKDKLGIFEVQTFAVPFEASGCATSQPSSEMYISTDDDKAVYVMPLQESTAAPKISRAFDAPDDVTGLAVYVAGATNTSHYVFVAAEDSIAVFDHESRPVGTLKLSGYDGIEVQGLDVYQASTSLYPQGVICHAIESKQDTGFGVTSLDGVLAKLGIQPNTKYDPRRPQTCPRKSPVCGDCGFHGYCRNASKSATCECFAGFGGSHCEKNTCTNDCSGRGKCVGPNQCKCDKGWGGIACSFLLVEPSFETDAAGGDGDDPAIWISPASRTDSRIITTTKSEQGAGLSVFDLSGNLLQTMPAGEPNNVDVIYSFEAGSRTIDLAFAACRKDDTLCLFEMLPNGTLANIPGGIHPVVTDFSVYGSCTYRSPKSGKQYLFVNEKSARYLQYELSSTSNGTLETTLVREFKGGSGGQVEGCVTDEQNGWIFLGEEPSALWRYDAEPDSQATGTVVAKIGDGHLYGDVEGVTLVMGRDAQKGFVIVSCQGVSAYNVYRRAPPHEYVTTFTLVASSDGKVDAVSNTDGVTAVGTALGPDFPFGMLVTHDDANQLPNGSTSALASFKITSLSKILGADQLKKLKLLDDVDANWDPRAAIRTNTAAGLE
ncbi:hypothetical protein PLIIFM63780_003558 [Purpureocillium lilacinum]|nr:hypothetical protein PLIIFM63780_003558 [Purpureocillium lilacinum]